MRETWLRTNTRALALAMILPGFMVFAGAVLAAGAVPALDIAALRLVGVASAVLAAAIVLLLAVQMRQPRLACDGHRLLVYLRGGGPIGVPIELVEGFLLGQGPSGLAGAKYRTTEAATVVIRLSQRAEEWGYREVKRALGSWCNHYVTIRGTWCEPLSVPLVNRLNERLAAAQQSARQEAAS